MATARTAPAPRRLAARSARAASGTLDRAAIGIRWDRVGRVALLLVLFGVLMLYVRPGIAYISAWQQARAKRAEIGQLERENTRLRGRRDALRNPQVVEAEARRLGMVRPGERPYVVDGLR
jgi:cell division protein FtsB